MKVYGYLRVSTETQAEKGYGLEAQRAELEKYAAAHGIELADVFTDAGISGAAKDTADDNEAISKRAGLLELLATLENGDAVLVLNTSRLWRSDNTKVLIRREIMKRHASIISIEQPKYDIYAKDPNDRLIAGIIELLDEWERLSIALKLARGRTVKAKGGDKPAGVCPYGYQYTEDRKHVIPNENEATLVKFMFTEGQKGRSLGQICDALNAQGITTRQGKQWSRGGVQGILRNVFYTGVLMHQNKPIKGNHEPIISKVQFGKVAKQLDARKRG
jgi:site-specific DNA recombinase